MVSGFVNPSDGWVVDKQSHKSFFSKQYFEDIKSTLIIFLIIFIPQVSHG